jgi:hypothetical protein
MMQTAGPIPPHSRSDAAVWDGTMELPDLTDESLLAYYESVRRQVMADDKLGGRHRLAGTIVRQYADRLRSEMNRRRLQFKPIIWP